MTVQPGGGPSPQQHNTAASGGVVYAVQNGDQYVYLYRNKPPYRVQPWPARPPPVPQQLVQRPPSWLLAARHQVVPFYGRDQELAWLRNWRDGPALGVSVRLVHAPGGQGKTRLAAQFAGVSTGAGWTVAMARHHSETATAGGGDQQLAVYQRGLVLIVDYAERWPLQDVLALLGQHQAAASTPVRVLLLARPGGGWWQSLAYQLNTIDIDDIGQWELGPLAEHPPYRRAIYDAARDRFAIIFGLPTSTMTEPDLSGPQFEQVLAVHMKALVDVDAATRELRPPSGRDQAGLSCYLLDREDDYWRAAHQHGTGPVRTSELGMCRTVYTATLTRALSHRDGVNALTRANIGEATTQPISQILADHAILYPPADPDTVLEPLYPDRLGEDFLALTTPGHTDTGHTRIHPWAATLPTQLLTPHDGDRCPPPYARAAITTLIEAAHRWPHLAEGQLYPILCQQPRLALTAGGAALTRLADLPHPGILDVLKAIEPQLPKGRHVDLDSGIAALTTRLTTHQLATTSPTEQARLYHNLGYRLKIAGQHEQALDAITKAVEIYRQLAAFEPAAFEPHRARALSDLGGLLLDLGQREEALTASTEAVDVFHRIAGLNPVVFEPALAQALGNQGVSLLGLGRREAALTACTEAVDIYRRLAGLNPAASEPDLAQALGNLGGLLLDLGKRDEALAVGTEAVDIFRRLAGLNPAASEPDLARALTTLGPLLWGLGRRVEALTVGIEAIDVYRRLAGLNPAAFEPALALALSNQGAWLSGLGRRNEALAAGAEAVDIFRRLAGLNPAAFDRDLARALSNLANRLLGLGRREEALTAGAEAVDIFRRLAALNPAAFEPDLARALSNLGTWLSELGRRKEALAADTEAVDIFRRLAALNPAAFEPDLARALTNLANRLPDLGRRKALAASTDAIEIYRRLAGLYPAAFEPDLAQALINNGILLLVLGRREKEALATITEAVEVFRRLARINPTGFESLLARGLWAFARARAAGRMELSQALSAAEESVAIYGRLAQRLPETFAGDLQGVLATRTNVLNAMDRNDDTTSATATPLTPPTPKISWFRRWFRRGDP